MIKRVFSSSLFKSVGVYSVTNVINSAIPFFMLPIMTRYLTPQDYGIVAMFTVMVGVVMAFTGLSVQGAIGRQYFEEDTIDFPKYVTNCLYILVVSSVIVGLILWFFSEWISKLTQFPAGWLWAVLLASIGQFIIIVVLTLWQVRVRPVPYSVFQVSFTLTIMSLSIWFVVGLGMNWQGRIQAQVIACVLFVLLGFIVLWRNGCLKRGYDSSYIRHALKFGIPLIPYTCGGLAISMTDRVLITKMVGIADTGIYVVGAQVGMIIGLIETSFNQAWMPWLFTQLKKNNSVMNLKIVKITYLYGILILITAILLSAIAPWFMRFFLGKNFASADKYVFWIAIGYAFSGIYKMFANYIFYVQTTQYLVWITFFTGVVNVFMCYILIRLNGAIGAAQGMMCASITSFLLTWVLASRLYKMPWNLKAA